MLSKIVVGLWTLSLVACVAKATNIPVPTSADSEAEGSCDKKTNDCSPAGSGSRSDDKLNQANSEDTSVGGLSINSVSVLNSKGISPVKGEDVSINLTLKNGESSGSTVTLSPLLTSKRFSDYDNIRLTSQKLVIPPGKSQQLSILLKALFQEEGTKKEYALGLGRYELRFEMEQTIDSKKVVTTIDGSEFEIGPSPTFLTAVFYSSDTFKVNGFSSDAMEWIKSAFGQKSEIFTPSAPGSTQGTYKLVLGNYEDMAGVKYIAKSFPGFLLNKGDDVGKGVADFGAETLGLPKPMSSDYANQDMHGYEIIIAHTPALEGATVNGNVLALGYTKDSFPANFTMAITALSGIGYDTPPLGFMMHAPEQNEHFSTGYFVWHSTTVDLLKSRLQENLNKFNP